MTKLYFVGDGPTDEAALPSLVGRLLGRSVSCDSYSTWRSLSVHHRGSGYDRKLRYVVRQAIDRGLSGVVAAVDRDKASSSERLKQMFAARDADRANANLPVVPTAIGQADPHLEAWLIDDEKALREAIELPNDAHIPSVTKVDPKTTFNSIVNKSNRCNDDKSEVIKDLAQRISLDRCNHRSRTGLQDFADDVASELG